MKTIVSKEVVDNCCNLCVAPCRHEGFCPCDEFLEKHNDDVRVADCGDVYFVKGRGVQYIGY